MAKNRLLAKCAWAAGCAVAAFNLGGALLAGEATAIPVSPRLGTEPERPKIGAEPRRGRIGARQAIGPDGAAVPAKPRPADVNDPLRLDVVATLSAAGGQCKLEFILKGNRKGQLQAEYVLTGPHAAGDSLRVMLESPSGRKGDYRLPLAEGPNGSSPLRYLADEEGLYALRVEYLPGTGQGVSFAETSYFATYGWYPGGEYTFADLLTDLDLKKPRYARAGAAIVAGDQRAAAEELLKALRDARLLRLAVQAGPGGSQARPSAAEEKQFDDLLIFSHMHTVEEPFLCERRDEEETPFGLPATLRRLAAAVASLDGPILHEPTVDGERFADFLRRLVLDLRRARYQVLNRLDGLGFQEAGALVLRALALSDFLQDRDIWLREMAVILPRQARGLYFPDGASAGGDLAGAVSSPIRTLLDLEGLAERDPELQHYLSVARGNLGGAGRYLLAVREPTGGWPDIGAQFGRPLSPAAGDRLQALYAEAEPTAAPANRQPTASFPPLSSDPAYGGLFVMRSDGEKTARYLALDFGPFAQVTGVPPHRDFGSLTATAYGQRFVVDAGGAGDAAALPEAHNLVTIDGLAPGTETYPAAGQPVRATWLTNALIDYAADGAQIAGLPQEESPGSDKAGAGVVLWRRGVLFVKEHGVTVLPDYWVVFDRFAPRDDTHARLLSAKYQFGPGLEVRQAGQAAVAIAPGGPSLRVIPADQSTQTEIVTGEGRQGGGQLFSPAGGTVPTPAALLQTRVSGPTDLATVLQPVSNPAAMPIKVLRGHDLTRRKPALLTISFGPERHDIIVWGQPEGKVLSTQLDLQFAGELALFRVDAGKLAAVAFVNLRSLICHDYDGTPWKIVCLRPVSFTMVRNLAGRWQLTVDLDHPGTVTFAEFQLGLTGKVSNLRANPGQPRWVD